MEPTPELVERALAWAADHLGDASYAGRCLAFVEDAYERSNGIEVFGGASAAESAGLYGTAPIGGGPPPAGALVFYACAGPLGGTTEPWGHCGLSLGDGRVIHAWDVVRVDTLRAVESLPLSPGWTTPRLIGWTPVERLLEDARPHALANG